MLSISSGIFNISSGIFNKIIVTISLIVFIEYIKTKYKFKLIIKTIFDRIKRLF